VAIFESLASKQKVQARNGMGLLVSGLFLTVITLNWHSWFPPVIFRGKDWTDFLHGVVAGVAIVIELTGMILLLRARTSARASKS
jgi:predicted acyltransferase